jgi:hypothetical protein
MSYLELSCEPDMIGARSLAFVFLWELVRKEGWYQG